MSNELDKLAAEMRKIKSSKQSRKNAMEAAMSAFGQEFSPEAKAAALNSSTAEQAEKGNLKNNLDNSQGFADDTRPTGQTTRETRVHTFGRQTMSKFNQLINFKPQTMMMAGSCAAALMAGLIILPNMGELGITDGAVETQTIEASVEVATAEAKVAPDVEVMAEARLSESIGDGASSAPVTEPEADEIVVTGSRLKRSDDFTSKSSTVIEAITADQLETRPEQDLTEALTAVRTDPSRRYRFCQ